jgi:hypothetical protein
MVVMVGKGDKAMFWHSSWVNRLAPKNIAPSLFLKSKRKNISILKAIENNIWIRHISPITTLEELHDYVKLWEEIRVVHRDMASEDTIKWKWTQDGQYTTQSDYHFQFLGRQRK